MFQDSDLFLSRRLKFGILFIPGKFPSRPSMRSKLTEAQVIEIYKFKVDTLSRCRRTFKYAWEPSEKILRGQGVDVAQSYGLDPKTVRAIWQRKTWTKVTNHLWKEEDSLTPPFLQKYTEVPIRDGRVPLPSC
jgi:hypothetical protein